MSDRSNEILRFYNITEPEPEHANPFLDPNFNPTSFINTHFKHSTVLELNNSLNHLRHTINEHQSKKKELVGQHFTRFMECQKMVQLVHEELKQSKILDSNLELKKARKKFQDIKESYKAVYKEVPKEQTKNTTNIEILNGICEKIEDTSNTIDETMKYFKEYFELGKEEINKQKIGSTLLVNMKCYINGLEEDDLMNLIGQVSVYMIRVLKFKIKDFAIEKSVINEFIETVLERLKPGVSKDVIQELDRIGGVLMGSISNELSRIYLDGADRIKEKLLELEFNKLDNIMKSQNFDVKIFFSILKELDNELSEFICVDKKREEYIKKVTVLINKIGNKETLKDTINLLTWNEDEYLDELIERFAEIETKMAGIRGVANLYRIIIEIPMWWERIFQIFYKKVEDPTVKYFIGLKLGEVLEENDEIKSIKGLL
ncbi:hypothetical protein TCON_0591 [Astathelohania contejeani]|uniref:Exocyst complex component EXOC2/Sec5 N-terminal domain-containing protein n=1 Tax=Astathelohania contejeani TaxID=164912 RepID=A0ABQ7I1D8_9MICR|nr:hypothetical protein TCON_0591 [Thelohania contejeani]